MAKKEFIKNGFYPIFDNCKNSTHKVPVKDKDGYKFLINLKSIRNSSKMEYSINAPSNPFSIENINLFLFKTGKCYRVISEHYGGSKKQLEFKCLKTGYK